MVSKTLEAHFRNQASPSDIDEKLTQILRFINPEYIDSFKVFRANLLWILQENPENEDIVLENLDHWIEWLQEIELSYLKRNTKAIDLASSWLSDDSLKEYNRIRKRL